MSDAKLTEGQAQIVRFLQRIASSHGLPDATEISYRTGHRSRDWAMEKLKALATKGLVEKVGATFSNSRTWGLTEAGHSWEKRS